MARSHFVFLISISLLLGVEGRIVTLRNRCNTTVWPSIFENYEDPIEYTWIEFANATELARNDYELKPRESVNITTPEDWQAMIWGCSRCSFDNPNPNFTRCVTGGCMNEFQCSELEGFYFPEPPLTSAILNINPTRDDSYWIDLSDGFNLPMSIFPYGYDDNSRSCQVSSCLSDINRVCPGDRQVRVNEEIVACENDCFGDIANCRPSSYASAAIKACPKAVIDEINLQANTFLCNRANYMVSFC